MAPEVPLVPCVGCGTHVPRTEMFGHGADLRCGDCAAALRDRLHPSNVRRSPLRAQLRSGPPRVTAGLVGLIVVLWVGFQLEATKPFLFRLILDGTLAMDGAGRVTAYLANAFQPFILALSHIDLAHVALNGFALWQAGRLVEMGWGGARLLLVVLGSATCGTAAGWLVEGGAFPTPEGYALGVTLGISGGVFGLYGYLIALRRHHALAAAVVSRVFLHSLLASTVLLVVLTELGGMRISHVAHAAGFLWGFLAGMAARTEHPARLLTVLALVVGGLCLLTTEVTPLGLDLRLFGGR